jgi:hypothetical protein
MKKLLFPIFQFTSRTNMYPVVLKTYVGFKCIAHMDYIQRPTKWDLLLDRNSQICEAIKYRNSL